MYRNVFLSSILVLLVGDVQAFFWSSTKPPGDVITNIKNLTMINEVVDVYTREMRKILTTHNMDPLKAPNVSQPGSVLSIEMVNLLVCNLSTIHRTGDVGIYENVPKNIVSINISIGFNELQVFANYKASNYFLESAGIIKGKIFGVNIGVALDFDFDTMQLNLISFTLTKNENNMEVKFVGDYEYMLNTFSYVVTGIFSNIILSYVEAPIKDMINNFVTNANEALKPTRNIV